MFAQLPAQADGEPLARYGGRPDGAAVDVEGCYWVAMFEGQRLLRLSPAGEMLREVRLPVRCADDALLRRRRPEDAVHHHLAREAAGRRTGDAALGRLRAARCEVDVPGLPVNFAS